MGRIDMQPRYTSIVVYMSLHPTAPAADGRYVVLVYLDREPLLKRVECLILVKNIALVYCEGIGRKSFSLWRHLPYLWCNAPAVNRSDVAVDVESVR